MSKIRIALVDNNRDLCNTLSELIEIQEDMELVGVAYDGVEALRLVERAKPELLLLDITMPYLDGIGVLERLAGYEDKPIVIVLTAFEQETMIQRIAALGAVYYIVKPFDTNTLFQRIRQFVTGKINHEPVARIQEEASTYTQVEREKSLTELEMEVTQLFHEMGIPAHFRGYAYLRDAIIISSKEAEVLGNITKNLYPRIAQKYNSTASGVESAIRHTIEIGWERGNSEFIEEFFGFDSQKGRFPTTAAFIAKIADKIRLGSKIRSVSI